MIYSVKVHMSAKMRKSNNSENYYLAQNENLLYNTICELPGYLIL